MSGEPKTLTPEKRPESAAATILRHLQAGPATVVELMDRIHADTTRPESSWRIITTHTVADTLSAIDALGDLLGQKFLSRDERGAIALTLLPGVPVVARDEAAVESFCSKCGWAGQATAPDYRHDGCNYSAGPVSDWKLYASQREAAELRAAVREYFAAWDDFEQREAAVPREERSRMNDRINAAWDELRRLAGGENEK